MLFTQFLNYELLVLDNLKIYQNQQMIQLKLITSLLKELYIFSK